MLLPACLWQCCRKHLIKQNYDLVAGPSNMRPRRAQCRGEKLPAYNAPSDDWGLIHARSRLDPIFGLCVCEVRTPRPMGARHTWGRDVRELTQAVFRSMFSPTSLGLLAGRDRHLCGRRRSLDLPVAALPDDVDGKRTRERHIRARTQQRDRSREQFRSPASCCRNAPS